MATPDETFSPTAFIISYLAIGELLTNGGDFVDGIHVNLS